MPKFVCAFVKLLLHLIFGRKCVFCKSSIWKEAQTRAMHLQDSWVWKMRLEQSFSKGSRVTSVSLYLSTTKWISISSNLACFSTFLQTCTRPVFFHLHQILKSEHIGAKQPTIFVPRKLELFIYSSWEYVLPCSSLCGNIRKLPQSSVHEFSNLAIL